MLVMKIMEMIETMTLKIFLWMFWLGFCSFISGKLTVFKKSKIEIVRATFLLRLAAFV